MEGEKKTKLAVNLSILAAFRKPRKIFNNICQALAKSELTHPKIRIILHSLRGVIFKNRNSVFIGPDVILDGSSKSEPIYIGEDVYITRGVKIIAHDYDTSKPYHTFKYGRVIIEDGVFIGFNSIIINARIGKGAVIGANSLVRDDVGDYAIAAGTPAKQIGERFHS